MSELPSSLIWIVRLFIAACVMASAILLGQTVIALTAGADWNAPAPSPSRAGSSSATSIDYSVLEINTPFGAPSSGRDLPATANLSALQDAPETQLDLVLHGFRIDGDANTSISVISASGGAQRHYRVGDAIDGVGDVILSRILADGVIIERQGQDELLALNPERAGTRITTLDHDATGQYLSRRDAITSGSAVRAAPPASVPENQRPRVVEERRAIVARADLETIAASLRFDANTGDVGRGLSVFPTRNVELFSRTGLRAGDVVIAVDNVPLIEQRDISKAIDTMMQRSEIPVELVRDGRNVRLVIAVQQGATGQVETEVEN